MTSCVNSPLGTNCAAEYRVAHPLLYQVERVDKVEGARYSMKNWKQTLLIGLTALSLAAPTEVLGGCGGGSHGAKGGGCGRARCSKGGNCGRKGGRRIGCRGGSCGGGRGFRR